jgi:fumarate hydratase subunit alpha
MVSGESVRAVVFELLLRAETQLPSDVLDRLKKCRSCESGLASIQLGNIVRNAGQSRKKKVPMCQDTGLPVIYVKVGGRVKIDLSVLYDAINKGILDATERIPLRRHMVDPISRRNVTDSLKDYSPFIHVEFNPRADYIELSVLPKGCGSENMSALGMLKPSEGLKGVKRFVIETVAKAGGNPCPPVVVGVGIGGSSDAAMIIAKKALLRKLGSRNRDRNLAGLEVELLRRINELGVGPMGLGGKTTALAVNIESAPCHTASLPVGVNIQCWADRRATARIFEDRVEYE